MQNERQIRIANKILTVIGVLIMLGCLYQLYKNYVTYPTPHFTFWSIVQIVITVAITVVTYTSVMIAANIISLANTILTLFNTVIFFGMCKLSSIYVNAVNNQTSVIPYSTSGSYNIFKILIYLILAILLLMWLKYILVIKHNLTER